MKLEENQLKELVEKAKQRDYAAFEELYSVSSRQVYFTCISFLGNEEDAKDVMQDVFITAYEKLSSLNDAEKFFPWIKKIAVNHCKKFLMKKSAVFMEIENAANELTEENENFLPEEYITQKEKRKLVMDIMRNTLSDIQYKTVILYYFNGLPVDEIANIMECPPGTVMYRLSVARAKIRDGVDAYENRSGDKLYSVVGLPLLMRLLYAEADAIDVPDMLHDIMEAVRLHLAAGQAENADAASNANTASTNHAANTSKGGTIKKMIKTPKTIIAAAAAAVVIIGGIAAAVIATNHESTPSSDAQTRQEGQQASYGAETDLDNQQASSGADTDQENQQASYGAETDQENPQASSDTGETIFWLHTAEWGEEKDLTGITLFNGECTAPIRLEDFDGDERLAPYSMTFSPNPSDYEKFSSYNLTELLLPDKIFDGYETIHPQSSYDEDGHRVDYDQEYESTIFEIHPANFSGEDVSLKQAYENNWFYINSTHKFATELGYEDIHIDDATSVLEAVINKYGRPSYLIAYDYDDTFLEKYERNSGHINYILVWEKEEFVITVQVIENTESSLTGGYAMTIQEVGRFRYITRELWDGYRDEYFKVDYRWPGYQVFDLDDLK